MANRRCGTCAWYARARRECDAPLPLWVRWRLPTYYATTLLPMDGEDCAAWKAREDA